MAYGLYLYNIAYLYIYPSMLSAKSSNGNRVREIERQIEPGKSSAKSNGIFFWSPRHPCVKAVLFGIYVF